MAKIVVGLPSLTQPVILYQGLGPAMLDNIGGVRICYIMCLKFRLVRIKGLDGKQYFEFCFLFVLPLDIFLLTLGELRNLEGLHVNVRINLYQLFLSLIYLSWHFNL
jgi:hypothetical protein